MQRNLKMIIEVNKTEIPKKKTRKGVVKKQKVINKKIMVKQINKR